MFPLWTLLLMLVWTGTTFAQTADEGKQMYTRRCVSCHGANGEGRESIAKRYAVQMRHLGSPEVQAMSDQEIGKLLKDGGRKAKPLRNLDDADIASVILYLRTLKQTAR